MSKQIILGKEYDVKLNKMYISPHLVINGITTDICIWDNTSKKEQKILLELAVKCYEYNKKNKTLIYNDFNIHLSEKVKKYSIVKLIKSLWNNN